MRFQDECIARSEEDCCEKLFENNPRLGRWRIPLRAAINTLLDQFPVYVPFNVALLAHDRFALAKRYPDAVPRYWTVNEVKQLIHYKSRWDDISHEIGALFPLYGFAGVLRLIERDPERTLMGFWVHVLQHIRENTNLLALQGLPIERRTGSEFQEIFAGEAHCVPVDYLRVMLRRENILEEKLKATGLALGLSANRYRTTEGLCFLSNLGLGSANKTEKTA